MKRRSSFGSWIVSAGFRYVLRTLSHPVTLISILGPPFLVFNVHWMQILLTPSSTSGLSEFQAAVQNAWTFAISDYLLQLYTLLLVVIVYYGDIVRHIFIYWANDGKFQEFASSNRQKAFLLISAVALVVFLIVAGNGLFGRPWVAQLYYPEAGEHWGEGRFPPYKSPLTMARIIMLLLGFWLPYWIEEINGKTTGRADVPSA